ncbi:NADH dehydrogenase [ubiquinone] 1 beta subcomplex subunit 9 [Bemisia tabaci]|uniref:NADH dehydrogenase [ubiquinone] 1 beta subcomplex subunit 9 n=1 Tax=Bemisia tabaci TaxID=7038 RepID=UPI003B27DBB0
MVVKTVPYKVLTHKQIVLSLFKRAMRHCEEHHYMEPHHTRYAQVLMRARFDENKNVADPAKAKQLVKDAEAELHEYAHPIPIIWFDSPKGIGYERYLHYPDAVLDYWHPLEKAMYPEYFARREQRKKEYIEWYDKKYGKPTEKELASFY